MNSTTFRPIVWRGRTGIHRTKTALLFDLSPGHAHSVVHRTTTVNVALLRTDIINLHSASDVVDSTSAQHQSQSFGCKYPSPSVHVSGLSWNLCNAVILCLVTLSQGISTSDMDFGGRTATMNRQKLIQSGGKCGQDDSLIVNLVNWRAQQGRRKWFHWDVLQGCFLGIG